MLRFKSMILFLAFLLMIQPVFQGCTVLNYRAGKSLDIGTADIIAEGDLSDLGSGDYVEIEMKNGSIIRGQIEDVIPQLSVKLKI